MSTETRSKTEERATRLLAKLESLRDDRGLMAALRRARLEGADLRAFPAFARLGVVADDTGQAVACFFARHPTHFAGDGKFNFGGSCHLLTGRAGGSKRRFPLHDDSCSFDARFRRLLASHDRAALITRVRQVLPLLEHEGIAVDYVRLYRDIVNWGFDPDRVRRWWSVSYWGGPSDMPAPEAEREAQPVEVL